jgi:Hint domain
MLDFAKPLTGIRRSRRNLVKMGVIGASAAFASLITTRPVTAQNGQGQNNQGQNNQGQNNQDQNNQGQNNQGQNNQGGKCFLKGTTIRTADGNRKIEDLAVGDLLPTVFGGICAIQWIGHYPYKKSDQAKPWVKQVLPVRIARSALGPDMPHADLYVTKEHALLIDGVLVTAGSLINGTTIVLYDASYHNELEFFHIKLARHNVIYAEGTPCETVLNFDESAVNFVEYLRHYGSPITQEAPCAPLLSLNGARNEIKSCFRSAISPWIDRRQKIDIIRDELEERGIALLRQVDLVS